MLKLNKIKFMPVHRWYKFNLYKATRSVNNWALNLSISINTKKVNLFEIDLFEPPIGIEPMTY